MLEPGPRQINVDCAHCSSRRKILAPWMMPSSAAWRAGRTCPRSTAGCELDRRGNWRIKGERIGNARVARIHRPQLRGRRARLLVFPERPAARVRRARLHAARPALRRRARCSTTAARPFEPREACLGRRGLGADSRPSGNRRCSTTATSSATPIRRAAAAASRAPTVAGALRFRSASRRRHEIRAAISLRRAQFPLYNPASFLAPGRLRGSNTWPPGSFLEISKTCLPSIS